MRNKPVEQKSFAKKPERQIPIGHRFSIKKTSVMLRKTMKPRSCLRWQPTGTLNLSAGTQLLPSDHNQFRTRFHDHIHETVQLSKLVPNVVFLQQTKDSYITTRLEYYSPSHKTMLRYDAINVYKRRMPTKIELTLEQSQQGVSNDVLANFGAASNLWCSGKLLMLARQNDCALVTVTTVWNTASSQRSMIETIDLLDNKQGSSKVVILRGTARVWFDELPPKSIDGYKDLKAAFLAYFMQQKKYVKDPVEIHNIKQRDGESLEDFIECFKVETGRMKGAPECMRISRFMHGVNNPELTKRLNEHVPKTMEEMMTVTTAFIRGETAAASKKKGHALWKPHDQSKRHVSEQKSDFRGQSREGRGSNRFTPLTRMPKEILTAEAGKFKPPPPMVTSVEKRSNNKFCDFHNDKGHNTDGCMQLKKQIEELVRNDKAESDSKFCPCQQNYVPTTDYQQWDGGSACHRSGNWRTHGSPHVSGDSRRRRSFYKSMDEFDDREFPVNGGIVTIRRTILIPAECTTVTTSSKEILKEAEVRHENLKVVLHSNFPNQEVEIEGTLSEKGRTELCSLLKENLDIFAWQPSDMTGKKRGQSPERAKAIQAEVQKLVEAGIMREVHYHDWLSNPVMVKKHDGSWRMCVDFTDLNKACPQDCYHQIQMAESDEEKTAFHTSQGVYCYTKMPFGLKNAGATYQRLVDKAFNSQVGRNVEVYVDDLVIKSYTEAEMLRDVDETFRTLQKINMKLNPKKCTFGAVEGMFLGYMISREGIKPRPDKIDVVLQLPSPRTIKEVQSLNGKLASLNRSGTSLQATKTTLVRTTPAGSTQTKGRVDRILVCLLRSCPELNYAPMEKLVLALVFAAKRLRRYFQAHPIVILADFLVEKPDKAPPDTSVVETPQEPWTLFTDGSSCVDGSGAGLILTSLEGTEFTYALRFQFTTSNNKAKYEALIAGLRIAAQMGVHNLHVSVDSKLVANQFLGTYIAKEDNMVKRKDQVATVVEEEGPTWMTPIVEYLRDETLPDDKKEASKLRIKAR
ncbi:reverse transcriptase domain-containing protein [Tanacetum coccineum]